jgi:hypothetical protein
LIGPYKKLEKDSFSFYLKKKSLFWKHSRDILSRTNKTTERLPLDYSAFKVMIISKKPVKDGVNDDVNVNDGVMPLIRDLQ